MQPIQRSLFVLALAAFLAVPAHAAPPKGGKSGAPSSFKCWLNNEGVQECGNAVPPEYSQGATETVNKQGVTVNSQGRAQTREERAAIEKSQREAEEKAAEEKRQREIRHKADQVLLATFASDQDIIMARDRKITALEGTIELTNVSIGKQQKVVEGYQARIAALEKSGKPVPPEMQNDMATEQQKLDNKTAFVAAKRAEVEAIKVEYEGYLTRYRELVIQRK